MVLSEGGVQLRLHGDSLLSGLREFFFQSFRPKHSVAEALEHAGLFAGPLSNVLRR
jgi:hypothetical protein